MNTLVDKFEEQSLSKYSEKAFGISYNINTKDESRKLFRDCGFAYFEKILKHLI